MFYLNLIQRHGPDIISIYNKKTGVNSMVFKFKTESLPLFVAYRKMFYKYN